MANLALCLATFATAVFAHSGHSIDQEPLAGPYEKLWYNTLPGDGGTQVRKNGSTQISPNAESNRPIPSSLASARSGESPTFHA